MKVGLVLTCLLLGLPPMLGCKAVLYPVARAFGGPSEGELKQCRAAFERLQAHMGSARILVHPALDPRGAGALDPDTAGLLVALLRESGMPQARPAPAPPEVEPTPLGRNQLRYTWTRAHAYADWVRRARPEGDFFLFVEMLRRPSGEIVGIQTYILEASGDIAYVRLLNSHQFGRPALAGPREAVALLHRVLRAALSLSAEAVFPPHGVG